MKYGDIILKDQLGDEYRDSRNRARAVALPFIVVAFITLAVGLSPTGSEAQQPGPTELEVAPEEPSSSTGSPVEPSFGTGEASEEFTEDRIIVKLEEEADERDLREINEENDAEVEEELPVEDLSVVDLPRDLPVEEAVEVYGDEPDVEYAEPDYLLEPTQTPNDPSFSKLYGLHNTGQGSGSTDADIDAPQA